MSDYPSRFLIGGADDLFASSFAASYAGVVSFLAVVKAGSFSRAGTRLGIGRSSVRRNMQTLEAQLDTCLFLCSPLSRGITGSIVYVDAGYHIMGV